jgi:hypothetical protein
MRLRKRLFALSGIAVATVVIGLSAENDKATEVVMLQPYPHPKGYVCYRASGPIAIDGNPNEASWGAVPWSDDFGDIEGDKQPKPPLRTRVKLLWDDEALYIAAQLEEPHIWANLTKRDCVIFYDNDFEVFLSTTGDNHTYCELELNALNTVWDLLLTKPYKDGGKPVTGWDIMGLKTAVRIDGTLNDPSDKDVGWTVEIKWPWEGLKELSEPMAVPPKAGDKWRINFSRVEWDTEIAVGKYRKIPDKTEHNWVWSPQGVIDMHRPERWGYLQFSTAKPGSEEFKPDPTWAARDLLHRTYYAQRVYRKAHGKYAATLAELGMKDAGQVKLEGTSACYEASISIPGERGAKAKKLTIASDSRIWEE